MGLLTRLFGRSLPTDAEPWTTQSAYSAIHSRIDPSTGRLTGEGSLPDEDAFNAGSKISWAPGAMDGVFNHHATADDSKETATRLAKLIDQVARTGDRRAVAAAYAMMRDEAVLGLIDPVIELLGKYGSPIEPHLSQFALKLARGSADRGPVKVGIALLGAARLSQHREVVETLGVHDEFTLFSAVALGNMLDDAEDALWRLASKVDGWGRIQIVERLPPIKNPAIQHWLRTEGFRNSVLYDYLALTAAEHGRLREALDRPNVPASELVAASEIIVSMIAADHGPSAGMNSYSEAAATSLLYLDRVRNSAADLNYYIATHALLAYVATDSRPSDQRLANGWSEAAIDRVQQLGREIIETDAWRVLIVQHLDSNDRVVFHQAADAAEKAGIDAFPWHWNRLRENPNDAGAWYSVMRRIDANRIDSALELAEQSLPLDSIATGPAEEMGLGAKFESHSCLDAVLQDLKAFPGRGSRFIAAGLLSPVVRNRHMALNALEAWDRAQWTDEIRHALNRLRAEEVNENVSKRLNEGVGV